MGSPSETPPAADLDWTAEGAPRSQRFDDIYFSTSDGLAETRAVFLQGCDLPQAWRGRDHFVVGELGFGTGLNILALLQLWKQTRVPGQTLSIFSVEAITRPEPELRALQDTWWQPAGGGSVSLRMPIEDVAQWSREAQGWVLGKGTSIAGSALVSSGLAEPRDLSVAVRAPGAGVTPPLAVLTSPGNGARVRPPSGA